MDIYPPLFISSRLMAAVTIGDSETGGILHLNIEGRNDEGRVVYSWVITDGQHKELERSTPGGELNSGVGDDPDYTKMMGTFISFLESAAETYRHTMGTATTDTDGDPLPFNPAVMEWAYMNSEELSQVHMVLEPEMYQ
jgi:hypothetical protein